MNDTLSTSLLWVFAAAIVGFGTAWFFADVLHWQRSIYLIPYATIVTLFAFAYVRWSGLKVFDLIRHRWHWGLVGAAVVGSFVVSNVLSQPVSPRSGGLQLIFDVVWLGVIYGVLDALLLSIIPVNAVWRSFSSLGWTKSWIGKLVVGLLALAASVLVTAAYHLGYSEYRNAALGGPIFGNTIISLGYLLTGNPLAAVGSHVAMHLAAVLHGPATVIQLPPH